MRTLCAGARAIDAATWVPLVSFLLVGLVAPSGLWAQPDPILDTVRFTDKVFGKNYVLAPDPTEVMVQFEPDRTAADVEEVIRSFGLREVHPFDPRYSFGVYASSARESLSLLLPRIESSPAVYAVLHPMIDQEGFKKYFIPRELTVQFKKGVSRPAVLGILDELGSTVVREQWTPGYFTVSVPVTMNLFQAMKVLNTREEVLFAEPSYFGYDDALAPPDDPLFPEQWHLQNTGQQPGWTTGADMNVPAAWNVTTGDPDVIIAIIDTGIDLAHPDLVPNTLPRNGEDWNFASPTDDSPDDFGNHGTACSGIAAAVQNNTLGVSGVAPGCRLMPLKVDLASGANANRADAINYAASRRPEFKAMIMSLSWRMSSGDFTAVQLAVQNAWASDCVVLAASGNFNTSPVQYPARYPEVIAVGATSPCDERKNPSSCDGETWGSNFGSEQEVVAPGVKIVTTDRVGLPGYSSDDYALAFNGTSAACPGAAGVAALIYSANPSLSNQQVRTILRDTAQDQVGLPGEDTPGFDIYMGHGRVDAHSAVLLAADCGFCIDSSDPPHGAIDARIPHDLNDQSIVYGWDSVELTFTGPTSGLTASDFTVAVTGGSVPVITNVIAQGDVAIVQLDRSIPAGQWTQLTHNLSASSICLGYLPGDVNNDGTSAPTDILQLIDHLNGVVTFEEWQCDIDRSDLCAPPDILRVIDLLNGAAEFEPWLYVTLPPSPCGDMDLGDCLQCDPPGVDGAGPRYLAVTPDPGPYPVSLLVRCPSGAEAYVGPPEGAANIAYLVDDPGQAASLLPEDWGETVYVTGETIAPSTTYEVRTNFGPTIGFSRPGTGETWQRGDANHSDNSIEPNFVDVSCVVNAFQGLYGQGQCAPMTLYSADQAGSASGNPCRPNGSIDVLDIVAVIDAFQGIPYDCPESCLLSSQRLLVEEDLGASLDLVPSTRSITPGNTVEVSVFVTNLSHFLKTYQVAIDVAGGSGGSLLLESVTVDTSRADYVFAGGSIVVVTDESTGRGGAMLDRDSGIIPPSSGYLATYTLRATSRAQGTFSLSVREADTILKGSRSSLVEVGSSTGTTISVISQAGGGGHGPKDRPKKS